MGKVGIYFSLVLWSRGQGQLRVCHDMFKKNLSKVIDDPGRFGSAYISFLAEEGTIRELNTGYTSVRKVLHKQVRDSSALILTSTGKR
jgi:hypothetical protein